MASRRRRRLRPLFPLLIVLATTFLSCGPVPSAEPAPPPTLASGELAAGATATVLPPATPTPTAPPAHTPRPAATPSATARPTATPTATPTPPPTLPPLLPGETGEPLDLVLDWRFDGNGHLTAVQAGEGETWITSLGRAVYALDGRGRVRWRAHTGGPAYALAALPGGGLAAGDDSGLVTRLDAAGNRLWQHDLHTRATSLFPVAGYGLLAGGWDERLTLLDGEGEVVWQAGVEGPLTDVTALSTAEGAVLAVAATLAGRVVAFAPDGAPAWQLDGGAPVVDVEGAAGLLVVGLQDGRLLGLDAEGNRLWQQTLGHGAPAWQLADLGDGRPVILAGSAGPEPFVALLSLAGEVIWRTAVASPVAAIVAADPDGDRTREILAGLADGTVLAYDARGRLRASVHAGLPVWHLAAAPDGSAVALADVVAWRITAGSGSTGGPWLPPPALLAEPPQELPPGSEPREGEVVLAFLGDVSPGRSMEFQLARNGPDYPWSGLGSLLAPGGDHDVLAVANLEAALGRQGRSLDKPYVIRAHPVWGQMLAAGGIDLVTLANNHVLDYGAEALDETLATLEDLSIAVVGAGEGREAAQRPAILSANGVRVAVLGYAAARWNGSADVPATDRLAWAVPAAVQAGVRAAREQADLVVVLLHAGTEYAAEPSADQVAVAHAAIDAGADLVVGHHPHVTQTVERYGRGLIVYSLGDAIFDIPRPAAMRGELLRVLADRNGLTRAELWPFWIEAAIRPRLLDDGSGQPQVRPIYP